MRAEPVGTGALLESEAEAVQALEALIIGNPELDELELLLSEFNMFEAMGMVRKELHHSHFLAFLLDPSQNHGLGDAFVTRLLQTVLLAVRGAPLPVAPLDLDVWSLEEISVQREWQHIDLLLLDKQHHLAVVVENKVDSIEHSDQLARYYEAVRRHHPDKVFFGIYLTPDGAPASHAEFLSCSYGMVAHVIQELIQSRKSTMGEDVRTGLRHYHQMLHRHIMSESRIAELCQSIYRKHQRALDLLFEHRPVLQFGFSELISELVEATPGLTLEQAAKASIRFRRDEWDGVPGFLQGTSPTDRLLFFYMYSGVEVLELKLYLGVGPRDAQEAILALARDERMITPAAAKVAKTWKTLEKWTFLRPESYQSLSRDEMEDQIRERWQRFVDIDLPRVLERLSTEKLTRALVP